MINTETLQAINGLLKTKIPLKRTVQQRQKNVNSDNSDADDKDHKDDSDYDDELEGPTPKRLNDGADGLPLNIDLASSIFKSIEAAKNLPIAKHKATIMQKLEKNRVIIISGDTGCGKTTQVPKFILESGLAQKQDVKIICTQPRRLAAVSIAKRVAQELNEKVGQTVGYHVGMQSRKTRNVTKVLFMTTGIFLQRLVNNPDSLRSYTHLIMDEVHERDLDIDFSLVVVKHLLASQKADALQFKLILMSATFNYELFANYFSKSSITNIEHLEVYVGAQAQYDKEEQEKKRREETGWGPASSTDWASKQEEDEDQWVVTKPIVSLPVRKAEDPADVVVINARCFKVTEFYIDDMIDNILKESEKKRIVLTPQDRELLQEAQQTSSAYLKANVKEAAMRVATIIICDVIERLNSFEEASEVKASILIFLPGLAEILQFIEYIGEFYDKLWIKQNLELIPLHSSLNEEEQDRAFKNVTKMEGRRKVIVSTNLAESSITIPDVKYVVDFMLTKEVHYDPASRSESLQLTWCSQANATQRAGRAGRVSDGFTFRMVTKQFYNHSMPAYPMPEMQRCPLEKLILQIKLWNRYEPEMILGRAIQPPELRDITNAIKNLQQTGALTTPPPTLGQNGQLMKKSVDYVPKITALGKIFVNLPVDLKITRMFLFGMSLKCMHQAIIMGCIHSQSRSIFRRCTEKTDPVNLCKLQIMYDEQRNSDSIMLLRVYQEWIHKFHPYLKHKKEDEEKLPNKDRRVFIKRPLISEKKWCQDRNLDMNVLRDIAQLVEEIRLRFTRMNISPQCLNSKVKLWDEESKDGELILKLCIGGAFYNKYVKAAYKNEDQLKRSQADPKFDFDETTRTLVLNKISEHINENHLKQFFEAKFKVTVQKISLNRERPMIVFGKEILETGFLKAAFKIGMRSRLSRYKKMQEDEYQESKQFRSAIMSDPRKKAKDVCISYDEAREMLETDELRRPNHLYELRFETINKEAFVDFEQESINNFACEMTQTNLPHVTFACQDYYDKGGRFLCRNSTRLPDVPMVDALFCLIYAPLVQVMADENKRYFSRLVCDGGELILSLTHVLTHQDLQICQQIRTMLNETLCDSDKQKQAHMTNIDRKVKQLFSFRRLSVDIYIKLEALREEDETNNTKQFLKTLKQVQEEEDNFFFEQEAKGFEDVNMTAEGEVLEDLQVRYEQDCERGYFLQPIYVQKIQKEIHLYDDLVGEMLKEFQQRIVKKRGLINEVKQKCKQVALRDCMIICDRCDSDLAPLKTVDYISNEMHFCKCVFGTFKKVEVQDALGPLYQEDREFVDIYLDQNKVEQQIGEKHEFAFCACRKGHIVGIVKDQKYYLTEISSVYLMFPSMVKQQWDERVWQPKYKSAFDLQDKLNYQRAQQTKSGYRKDTKSQLANTVRCELCKVTCGDPDDFIIHCKKDRVHQELELKFTDETFDFLFASSVQTKSEVAVKE